MAAKNSKPVKYVELSATITNKVSNEAPIDIAPVMVQLIEDKKRLGVINIDTIFDEFLKHILMLHFSKRDKKVKKLFEPSIGGPLVSLTYKARLAYALRIIDETALNDLENIHNIRNKFAHNTDASFAGTEVIKSVKKLSTAKGKEVTAKNSYKCFESTKDKCTECLIESLNKAKRIEILRPAALQSGKEDVQ